MKDKTASKYCFQLKKEKRDKTTKHNSWDWTGSCNWGKNNASKDIIDIISKNWIWTVDEIKALLCFLIIWLNFLLFDDCITWKKKFVPKTYILKH